MPALRPMPPIVLDQPTLKLFGDRWHELGETLTGARPHSSSQLSQFFAEAVGRPLAVMLGDVPVVTPNKNHLIPSQPDCVEIGELRVIGGVRPQNFDVGYRPDGVRFVLDSKTLNNRNSVAKNYQNMINDLATEATTVHTRFPYALVCFVVGVPAPCLVEPQTSGLIGTLERLGRRNLIDEPAHMAEAIALVVWDPATGDVLPDLPSADSTARIERMSERIQEIYVLRYKGLPPHAEIGAEAEEAEEEAEEAGL